MNRFDSDLSSNSIYVTTCLTQDEIAQKSNDFDSRYGIAPNPRNQEVPYYKGLAKCTRSQIQKLGSFLAQPRAT